MTASIRPSPASRAASLSLREREDALAAIRRGVDSGPGAVVLGPAASGRTRMLTAFAADTPRSPFRAGGPVQIVDDVERLRTTELDELAASVARGVPTVVAERADTRATLDRALARWASVGLAPVVLGPLSATSSRELLTDLLGDPMADESAERLCSLARGRPGDLVELTLGSLETASLVLEDGSWHVTGEVAVHRLATDIDQRLGPLREVAEIVAVAEPLPRGLASRVLGRRRHEELHRDGTLTVNANSEVVFARPAEGEWLRASCSPDQRRERLRVVVDAATGDSSVPVERVASWHAEAGGGAASVFLSAAAAAHVRGAFSTAAWFATEAMRRGSVREAAHARGIARANVGDLDGARRDLSRASTSELGRDALDPEIVDVALQHAALLVGSETPGHRTTRVDTGVGPAYRALQAATRGHVAVARELIGGVAPASVDNPPSTTPPVAPQARRLAAVASAVAGVVELDRSALDTAAALWTDSDASPLDIVPVASDVVTAAEVELTSATATDVAEARRIAQVRANTAERDDHRVSRLVWENALGIANLAAGDLAGADASFARAARVAARLRVPGADGILHAHRAWVAVQTGAGALAQRLLAHIEPGDLDDLRVATRVDLIAASTGLLDAASAAEVDAAAGRVIEAGDLAVASGQLDVAIRAYALPVRVGHVSEALLDRIRAFDHEVAVPTSSMLVAHAEGLRAGELPCLLRIADRYVAGGRRLRASEVLAQAGRFASTDHLLRARAAGLLASCAGAWSPLLADLPRVELRPRLRDIGRLVVDGCSNSVVAARLSISVRTVESTLTELYRLLGVTNRRELIRVHAPLFA